MIEEIQEVVDALCAQTEQLQKDKTQIAELAARLEAELYAVLTERNVQADEIEQLRMQLADHGEALTHAERLVYESGLRLGEAHKRISELQGELRRVRGR
jgi:septal ring factor EnvC (AmiA/AmiB activator)